VFLNWRYSSTKNQRYVSSDGLIFVASRFRDKADVLYWSEVATEEQLLDFANFLYDNENVTRVCTWDTYEWLHRYPAEERQYHFAMNILSDVEEEKVALKNPWVFYMGDCELFL
jgi:hypothetical protein